MNDLMFKDPKNKNQSFYEATVLRVIDGDTIDVKHNYSIFRIRVQGIDAPESNQPFGWEATLFLKNLIENKKVYISVDDLGRYHRQIAQIYNLDFEDISKKMLINGFAWAFYDKSLGPLNKEYKSLQEESKKKQLGLWSEGPNIPPKIWREQKKTMNEKDKKILAEKKREYYKNHDKHTHIPNGTYTPKDLKFSKPKNKRLNFKI